MSIQDGKSLVNSDESNVFNKTYSPGANDELNICLKLVVLVSNTRLLAA